MKTLSIITLVAAVFSFSASAQHHGNYGSGGANMGGGFTGPNGSNVVSTVEQVLNSGIFNDDMPVTLTGYIKESLGKEKYRFADKTGTIVVEIDNDEWHGLNVTPSTLVTIYGEVDRDFTHVRVDVNAIRSAK